MLLTWKRQWKNRSVSVKSRQKRKSTEYTVNWFRRYRHYAIIYADSETFPTAFIPFHLRCNLPLQIRTNFNLMQKKNPARDRPPLCNQFRHFRRGVLPHVISHVSPFKVDPSVCPPGGALQPFSIPANATIIAVFHPRSTARLPLCRALSTSRADFFRARLLARQFKDDKLTSFFGPR